MRKKNKTFYKSMLVISPLAIIAAFIYFKSENIYIQHPAVSDVVLPAEPSANDSQTIEDESRSVKNHIDNKKHNFHLAIKELMLQRDSSDFYHTSSTLLEQWIDKDSLGALEFSKKMSTQLDDDYFFNYTLELAGAQNPEKTLTWLDNQNHESVNEREKNLLAAYSGIASADPDLAMQLSNQLTNKENQQMLRLTTLEQWVKVDQVQALDWINTYKDTEYLKAVINDAYLTVVTHIINNSTENVDDIIKLIDNRETKNMLTEEYAHKLVTTSPQEAITWSSNLVDDSAYESAISTILDNMASSKDNQWQAFDYAFDERDNYLRQQLLTNVTRNIALREPQVIAEKLDELPDAVHNDVIKIIADSWSVKNVEKTLDWISTLDNESKQDQATQVLVRNIMQDDPLKAELLITSIHDPVLRQELSNSKKNSIE